MTRVTRFQLRRSLNEKQRDALIQAYSYSSVDAFFAAREGNKGAARQYADTCRLIIGAFCVEAKKSERSEWEARS